MPLFNTPFLALRAISRVSRPASRLATLSKRLPQPLQPVSSIRFSSSEPLFPDPSSSVSQTSKPRPPHAPPIPKSQEERPNTNPNAQPRYYPKPSKPEYEMTFTCKPCSTRSTHRVSKQGYHYGSVLITCPECRNRHVISDHLNIFGDKHMTIEDLMREQGQLVKRGTLSEDGDLEFWADGSVTKRGEGAEAGATDGAGKSDQ